MEISYFGEMDLQINLCRFLMKSVENETFQLSIETL